MDIGTLAWLAGVAGAGIAGASVLTVKLAKARADADYHSANAEHLRERLKIVSGDLGDSENLLRVRTAEIERLIPLADLGARRREAMDRQHAKARVARAAKAAERPAKPARRRPAK